MIVKSFEHHAVRQFHLYFFVDMLNKVIIRKCFYYLIMIIFIFIPSNAVFSVFELIFVKNVINLSRFVRLKEFLTPELVVLLGAVDDSLCEHQVFAFIDLFQVLVYCFDLRFAMFDQCLSFTYTRNVEVS